MKQIDINSREYSRCKQVKSNKQFPQSVKGGLKQKGISTRMTCYQCESEVWNPVITGRLVA